MLVFLNILILILYYPGISLASLDFNLDRFWRKVDNFDFTMSEITGGVLWCTLMLGILKLVGHVNNWQGF